MGDVEYWLELRRPSTNEIVMTFGPFASFEELKAEAVERAKAFPQYSYFSNPRAKGHEPDTKNLTYFNQK